MGCGNEGATNDPDNPIANSQSEEKFNGSEVEMTSAEIENATWALGPFMKIIGNTYVESPTGESGLKTGQVVLYEQIDGGVKMSASDGQMFITQKITPTADGKTINYVSTLDFGSNIPKETISGTIVIEDDNNWLEEPINKDNPAAERVKTENEVTADGGITRRVYFYDNGQWTPSTFQNLLPAPLGKELSLVGE